MGGIGFTPCRTVVAEDLRDLQRRSGLTAGRYAGGVGLGMINGVSRSSGLITARIVLVATWV